MEAAIEDLKPILGTRESILADPSSSDFHSQAERWSDLERKIPSAIILPRTEQECADVIKWARKRHIPFVPRSGGNTPWSTIGAEGIIIDLSKFRDVKVDKQSESAVLTGGILSKEVSTALAAEDVFTPIGNGNSIGALPYFLNGGNHPFLSLTGYASDNILSARIVTASGALITTSPTENPDLLYSIRGAGQFFGLVTSLTVRTYPLSILGHPNNRIWSGVFVYPLTRAEEVATAIEPLTTDPTHNISGVAMIAHPPQAPRAPALILLPKLFGDPATAPQAFKPLLDLQPLVARTMELPIQNLSDAQDPICVKSTAFKHIQLAGLHRFTAAHLLEQIAIYQELTTSCPDATRSAFITSWCSRPVKRPGFESAMSHHDVRMWQNNMLWYEDAGSGERAWGLFRRSLQAVRDGQAEGERASYQNNTRGEPLEWRFRGEARRVRLRALKARWDPEGIFTDQFL